MFCCDDIHPHDLQQRHIDWHVKNALKAGVDIFQVLQMACLNPIEHYKLDVGMLQIGDYADFLIVEDLSDLKIRENYIDGKPTFKRLKDQCSMEIINSFEATEKDESDFAVPAQTGKLRVIKALDGLVLSESEIMLPRIEKGFAVADPLEIF
jgi:adenine deaminase